MLKAFWRVAPSVLLSFLAICDALVFFRAIVFNAVTSLEVQARRFLFLLAIKQDLPFKTSQLLSLMGLNEKPIGSRSPSLIPEPLPHSDHRTQWQQAQWRIDTAS